MESMSRLRFHHDRLTVYEKSVQRSLLIQLISEEYQSIVFDLAKEFVYKNREQLLESAEQHHPIHQVFSSKRRKVYLEPILANKILEFVDVLPALLEKMPSGRFYNIKQDIDATISYLKSQDIIILGCGFFNWENLFENPPSNTKIYIRHVAMEDDSSLGVYLQLVVS